MPKKTDQKTTFKTSREFLLFIAGTFIVVTLSANFLSEVLGNEAKMKEMAGVLSASIQRAPETQTPFAKENQTPLPSLTAKSYYAVDLATGKQLLAKDENEPALPASTTKMATALVAMAYYQPTDVLTVGNVKVDGHKMGLVTGEQITAENLFYGLLVFSGNDAAEVLAQNYPGGRENFIAVMNQLAKKLQLSDTHFTNPVGLDEYLHFSSAKDLVTLAQYGMKNPLFTKIVATKDYPITSIDGKIIHKVENTNELLDTMPGVLGVKTGWTENSGEDLVTLYQRDGHQVMLSVLGSTNRFGETRAILNWLFENYEWK